MTLEQIIYGVAAALVLYMFRRITTQIDALEDKLHVMSIRLEVMAARCNLLNEMDKKRTEELRHKC